MTSLAGDRLAPFRLRVVRIGVQATWLILAALAAYGATATDGVVRRSVFFAALAAAAAGAMIVRALPWPRLFESGRGVAFLYAWSILDIVLVTACIALSGMGSSEVFGVYALTTVFFAIAYPVRGQLMLLLFTFVCYLGIIAGSGWETPAASLLLRLATLATLSFLASFMSRELTRIMEERSIASEESSRRARMLETVARTARRTSVLDADEVLRQVVEGGMALGFDCASISVVDPDRRTYTPFNPMGLPDHYGGRSYPIEEGTTGEAIRAGKLILVDDYSSRPTAMDSLRKLGFGPGVAAPIVSHGEIVAVLVVSRRDPEPVSAQESEAVELLAAQAGRALEGARAYQKELATVDRLHELDRLKDDFIATVSHELKTPLTAVVGLSRTMDDRWDGLGDAERRDLVARMNRNARALAAIVETLTDFTKIERGRLGVHLQPIPLAALIRSVVNRLAPVLERQVVVVDVAGSIAVEADLMLLERVLENLLTNAARYTDAGTQVTVTAAVQDGMVDVCIADDGPGMPPEEVERLGEVFFRGGNPMRRTVPGTGLGLAFVRRVLDLHSSKLVVSSAIGRGTRLAFRLPAALARERASA